MHGARGRVVILVRVRVAAKEGGVGWFGGRAELAPVQASRPNTQWIDCASYITVPTRTFGALVT